MMNPNTGEIIAMADYPTFDSNDPRNLSSFDQTGDMSDNGKRCNWIKRQWQLQKQSKQLQRCSFEM